MARRETGLETSPPPVTSDVTDQLRSVVGRLSRYLRLTHVGSDLTPSQREVLAAIVRSGPLRLADLAAREGINPTMLSRIVAKLEAANLAVRTNDVDDARVVHVSVTSEGRALSERMRDERTDALRGALARLTPSERRSLEGALPSLEALVEALKVRER